MLVRRLLALPIVLVVAACSATGSSSAPAAATATVAASSTAASASESAAASASSAAAVHEIDAEDSSLGKILVDDQGNTIYFFAKDTAGQSNCTADCLASWPPVQVGATPEAGGGVDATLGTFTRDDGTTQLTVNDFPAYYFGGDSAAGDTNGQGVGGIWFVFGPDGKPIKS